MKKIKVKNPRDLKSTMNPYASKIMPIIGHPMITKKKPTPKEIVPCTVKGKNLVKNKSYNTCTDKHARMEKKVNRHKPYNFDVS